LKIKLAGNLDYVSNSKKNSARNGKRNKADGIHFVLPMFYGSGIKVVGRDIF
jgi:hypothetical protein